MLPLTMKKCIVLLFFTHLLGMATNLPSFLRKSDVARYKTMFLPFYIYCLLQLRSKSLKNNCEEASLYQNWIRWVCNNNSRNLEKNK